MSFLHKVTPIIKAPCPVPRDQNWIIVTLRKLMMINDDCEDDNSDPDCAPGLPAVDCMPGINMENVGVSLSSLSSDSWVILNIGHWARVYAALKSHTILHSSKTNSRYSPCLEWDTLTIMVKLLAQVWFCLH